MLLRLFCGGDVVVVVVCVCICGACGCAWGQVLFGMLDDLVRTPPTPSLASRHPLPQPCLTPAVATAARMPAWPSSSRPSTSRLTSRLTACVTSHLTSHDHLTTRLTSDLTRAT